MTRTTDRERRSRSQSSSATKRTEQLGNEEERLGHCRQLTRVVIANNSVEREGREGRPPPHRLRADHRPEEGHERGSREIYCILRTRVKGNAPARRHGVTIHRRRAACTMGDKHHLLRRIQCRRIQCRQDGSVERRPATSICASTIPATASATTTAAVSSRSKLVEGRVEGSVEGNHVTARYICVTPALCCVSRANVNIKNPCTKRLRRVPRGPRWLQTAYDVGLRAPTPQRVRCERPAAPRPAAPRRRPSLPPVPSPHALPAPCAVAPCPLSPRTNAAPPWTHSRGYPLIHDGRRDAWPS